MGLLLLLLLILLLLLQQGVQSETLKSEIDQMLTDTGLTNKRFCYTNVLSGGMKRKLSVAMGKLVSCCHG